MAQAMEIDQLEAEAAATDPPGQDWPTCRTLMRQAWHQATGMGLTTKRGKPRKNLGSTAAKIFLKLHAHAVANKQHAPNTILPMPKHPEVECRRWGKALGMRNTTTDAPRSGAPHKLPADAVKTALDYVLATCPNTQRDAGNSDTFQQLKTKYNVCDRTIWRAMQAMEPDLVRKLVTEFKQPLSAAHKAQRVAMAIEWLDTGVRRNIAGLVLLPALPDYPNVVLPSHKTPSDIQFLTARVMNTAFMDAKKLIVQGHAEKAWTHRKNHNTIVIHDPRVKHHVTLHWYAAVNMRHGGFWIGLVSGTQGNGYTAEKTFKVGYAGER